MRTFITGTIRGHFSNKHQFHVIRIKLHFAIFPMASGLVNFPISLQQPETLRDDFKT